MYFLLKNFCLVIDSSRVHGWVKGLAGDLDRLDGITANVDTISLFDTEAMCSKDRVQFWNGGKFDEDTVVLDLDGESENVQFFIVDTLTGLQTELFLVERACDLRDAFLVTNDTLGQDEGLLVWAHVLCTVPLATLFIVKDSKLRVAVQDRCTDIG